MKTSKTLTAIDLVMRKHWAMTPDALQNISRIALRKNEDVDVLAAKLGSPMKHSHGATVHGDVAVIPIVGPIFPKANMMTQMSGATSLAVASNDLWEAIENPDISAIVLDIDSPGGVAFGPGEFAEEVRAASEIKPVVAYVSGMACSAAYWVACGATAIVAHKTAILGSIGVLTAASYQEAPDMNGEMWVEIVSSNAENKRRDPSSDEGRAEIRRELDALETEFIAAVATLRSVSTAKVKTDFGRGGVLIAADAVAIGMADRTGSFEEVLSELQNRPRSTSTGGLMDPKKTEASAPAPQAAPAAPQIDVEAVKAEAFAAGATAERERILAIEGIAKAGHEKLVSEAKADGKSTAADVAVKMITAEKAAGQSFAAATAAATEALPPVQPSTDPAPAKDEPAEDGKTDDEKAEATWQKDAAIRKEFRTLEAYKGYLKGDATGGIKVQKKAAA